MFLGIETHASSMMSLILIQALISIHCQVTTIVIVSSIMTKLFLLLFSSIFLQPTYSCFSYYVYTYLQSILILYLLDIPVSHSSPAAVHHAMCTQALPIPIVEPMTPLCKRPTHTPSLLATSATYLIPVMMLPFHSPWYLFYSCTAFLLDTHFIICTALPIIYIS